jgi:hypothetical protein
MTLLRSARSNSNGSHLLKMVLKRKYNEMKAGEEECASAGPFLLAQTYESDLIIAFASVFADLCVFQRSANLLCPHGGRQVTDTYSFRVSCKCVDFKLSVGSHLAAKPTLY